ncbi:uncharacterized protein LOC144006931 isoform X2 [Festucalex cinctus]
MAPPVQMVQSIRHDQLVSNMSVNVNSKQICQLNISKCTHLHSLTLHAVHLPVQVGPVRVSAIKTTPCRFVCPLHRCASMFGVLLQQEMKLLDVPR